MKLSPKVLAPVLLLMALTPSPSRLEETENKNNPPLNKGVLTVDYVESRMICQGCTDTEQYVVDFLYGRGIKDPKAMPVLLGNIKQESNFHPNICEGGARVPYERCHRGGFGLIQFTTESRYNGLGHFANRYGGNPSELNTQLRYIMNEREWLVVEKYFKTNGLTKDQYMNHAYRWLGWGIYGNRGSYSHDYYSKLKVVD